MNLNSSVAELAFVGPAYQKRLEKLHIRTIKDLLFHIPHRYLDFSKSVPIAKAKVGEILTLKGEVVFIKNQYTKSGRQIQIGQIKDNTGQITLIWFNQPFLTKTLFPGQIISVAGKVDWFGKTPALISPEYEKASSQLHTGGLIPIYPETAGLSSKWLRARIKAAYEAVNNQVAETLSEKVLSQYYLLPIKQALIQAHWPESMSQTLQSRRRLAFDELLALHLASLQRKAQWQKNEMVYQYQYQKSDLDQFISHLPFELTKAQNKAVEQLLSDLSQSHPMNRLLEGDVGSGKTVVAAIGCLATYLSGHQAVILAPTQILAQQHYDTLKQMFNRFETRISLLTASKKDPRIKTADIIIGTHALFHQPSIFTHTALVVIDEQHKFGVGQRSQLVTKVKDHYFSPHVLTMTATPIPRTVALTAYGDLDLSVLDELPKGRISPTTWIVPSQKRQAAYDWISERIRRDKIQAFIICPLIEESTTETMADVKAVNSEFQKLKTIFKSFEIGLLHGRLKSRGKEETVDLFRRGKINILVSTPVVEVGLDIPNANIMVVEAADRFGLAQLHQLRGRIGRGGKKSYFLAFSQSDSDKVNARLNALTKESSGFKLAEIDLKLRGPGEIFGTLQHGLADLKIASWQDITLIKQAKTVASDLLSAPNQVKLKP